MNSCRLGQVSLLPGVAAFPLLSAHFWALAKCFSKAFCLLLASFSEAEEMDRGPEALDLVEGPLEVDLPFLEASASAA